MENVKRFFVCLALFVTVLSLGACDLTLTPSVPANITPPPPANTRTPTPTITPTVVPVSPTVDPDYFRDDFEKVLQPGWTWLREIPDQWSLDAVPGSLQILAGKGFVNSETMTNVLLRPAPAGDFQIETALTFLPEVNYQFAGLIVYDSHDNFIQAGHAFCRGGGCAGRGFYMDFYNHGILSPPNYAQPYQVGTALVMRLIRKGTKYIFQVSGDGKVFYVVGEHEADLTLPQVGVLSGQNVDSADNIAAVFDYFEVTSP